MTGTVPVSTLSRVIKLLQQASTAAARLPDPEQDAVAARLMDELNLDSQWDEKFAATRGKLAALATDALAEYRSGRTLPQTDDPLDLWHD